MYMHTGHNKSEANASNIELGLQGFYLCINFYFFDMMAADIRLRKISHRLRRVKVKTKEEKNESGMNVCRLKHVRKCF